MNTKPKKIELEIPASEYLRLRALAVSGGMTVPELLAQFVGDLTRSERSGGSDEREMARAYLYRTNRFGQTRYAPDERSRKNARRAEKWEEHAQIVAGLERAR